MVCIMKCKVCHQRIFYKDHAWLDSSYGDGCQDTDKDGNPVDAPFIHKPNEVCRYGWS